MKIEIIVKKETILSSEYDNNMNCAICKTMRDLGYSIVSAAGSYINLGKSYLDCIQIPFLNGTSRDLVNAFEHPRDVVCIFDIPEHLIPNKPKIVYKTVIIDSFVKELQLAKLAEN